MQITLVDLIALVGAVGAIVFAAIRIKPEASQLNGAAAKAYSEAAANYANQVVELQSRVTTMEGVIARHEREMETLRQERDELDDWCRRLVFQLQSMDVTPVPRRRTAGARPQ